MTTNSTHSKPSSRNLPEILPTPTAIRAERARRSFSRFVRDAWPTLYQGRTLQWGPYLEAICTHLQAVYRGDIRRLLMSLPPNTLKSTILSVCWPAWIWANDPSRRFLYATNDAELAERDALAMRELLSSAWYQDSFKPTWGIKVDQNKKIWFANTAGGHRISYSVNSKVTGKKGDILVVDDADDAKKVRSKVGRKSVHDWHDYAFSGRMADEKHSPEVVCGQRLHKDDLIGHCEAAGGWVKFNLSEEYDPSNHCRTPVWNDWRTTPGEWLRPERFGPAEKADAIGRMTSRGYNTQHKGVPQDLEGSMFKRGWFNIVPAGPSIATYVRYWDKAYTEDGGCFTAGVLISRTADGVWWIIDVIREQHSSLKREAMILATAHADRSRFGHVTTVVEQEPAGGKQSAEETVRLLAGFDIRIDVARLDKTVRAMAFAAQCEAGNVRIVSGAWNAAYLNEICSFPGENDYADQVDGSSGGFNWIAANVPVIPYTANYEPPRDGALDAIPGYIWNNDS